MDTDQTLLDVQRSFSLPSYDITGRASSSSPSAGITPSQTSNLDLLSTNGNMVRLECSIAPNWRGPVILEKLDSHKLFSDDMSRSMSLAPFKEFGASLFQPSLPRVWLLTSQDSVTQQTWRLLQAGTWKENA